MTTDYKQMDAIMNWYMIGLLTTDKRLMHYI